jgi:hypothetical protein
MDPLVILKSNEIPPMDPLAIPVHQINSYTAVCDSFSNSKFSKNGSTENVLFAVLFVMEGGSVRGKGKEPNIGESLYATACEWVVTTDGNAF